ncbi:MAG: DF family (seleno)protein [Solirubrobacteraceae bacterium]
MSRSPRIELLWWEGCPSTDAALAQLREILVEFGLGETPVQRREIRTDAEAAEVGFRGSPTILIDGLDVDAGAEPADPNPLTCRVYRRRDGRISPTPDPDDLREALRRAAARTEVTPT